MSSDLAIDVRELPSFALGRRETLWWAILLLMAIEGTGFGLLLMSYFYLRNHVDVWPPTAVDNREIWLGAATALTLLVSVFPAHRMNKCVYQGHLQGMRRWLIIATLVGFLAIGLRFFELTHVPFRWDSNAYGSVFWGALTLHSLHLLTGVGENILFIVLLYKGPVAKKHLSDLEVNGLYWYFVVGSWLPLYVILYLEKVLFP